MNNWLANIVGDVDSLHVEIDNLNDPLVGFCFIRSIDAFFVLDRHLLMLLICFLSHLMCADGE
jgi:hypothetical protein